MWVVRTELDNDSTVELNLMFFDNSYFDHRCSLMINSKMHWYQITTSFLHQDALHVCVMHGWGTCMGIEAPYQGGGTLSCISCNSCSCQYLRMHRKRGKTRCIYWLRFISAIRANLFELVHFDSCLIAHWAFDLPDRTQLCSGFPNRAHIFTPNIFVPEDISEMKVYLLTVLRAH